MKKLLLILSSFAVVGASSMVVISCSNRAGNKDDKDKENEKEAVRELIRQFESEVQSKFLAIVSSPMATRSTLLDTEASKNGLIFFQQDNLKSIFDQASANTRGGEKNFKTPIQSANFYDFLTPKQQKDLTSNVESLLSPAKSMADLRNAISNSTYSILIGSFGSKWTDNLKFDYENAEMTYGATSDDGKGFISSINLNFSSTYRYMDAEQATVTKVVRGTIVITVSDNGEIIASIDKINNELAGDMLKEANSNVYVDFKTLKALEPSLTTQDLITANTDAYKSAINKYNENLAKSMTSIVKNKYFINSTAVVNAIKVSYFNESDIIRQEQTSNFNNIGKITLNYGSEDWTAWNTFLGKVKTTENIQLRGNRVAGDETLYAAIEGQWKKSLTAYNSKIVNEYAERTKKSTNVEKNEKVNDLLAMSISSEKVTIKGLTISLTNGYAQRLSDVSFTYSIAIDKNATALSETTDSAQSKIFNSYYKGVENLLNVFQTFYGIQESDIWRSPNASTQQKMNKFKMSGKTGVKKEDGTEFNIWDYLKETGAVNGEIKKNDFVNALSLNTGVEAQQIKEQNLIAKMSGVTYMNFTYSDAGTTGFRNWRSAYIKDRNYTGAGGTALIKGLAMQTKRNSALKFGISSNLIDVTFGDDSTFDWNSLGMYTFIERI
ncbi:hypothetical protein CG007_02480 [Mesoplasma entomophilum]|uniref:hypothetical protein n=1 Tax=Mesoplasma entomophilum TaxID=2149 RepID=UPI000D03766F|nr:hypothetical protein [Mesoplasma entomophilum]AVN60467.1 hypothetical protein CG007_02480 [Mesoplasma entomophilum]